MPISGYQDSTVRVIWAYHQEDVGDTGPQYHESNRGTKSLRLLNPENTNVLPTALPYFDLVNQDVSFFRSYDCGDEFNDQVEDSFFILLHLTASQQNVTLFLSALFIKTGPHPKQGYDVLVPNV